MNPLPILSQGILNVLMSNAWFAGMPEAVRNAIMSRARGRTLARDECLFVRGDACDGIYVVIEGIIRLSGVTSEGRETILDFYGPGIWIGEVAQLGGGSRMYDAVAAEPGLVLQLSGPDLEELLACHPAFSRALLRLVAQRLRFVLTAVESYSAQSLEQRLANRLIWLAHAHGAPTSHGVAIGLDLSHETLGRLIGTTRQRVNQIVNKWQREGIVKHHYGRILLRNHAKLEMLARL
jgi:CRP/FNR family transcriptional regulator, cyclic AMP receptor protein